MEIRICACARVSSCPCARVLLPPADASAMHLLHENMQAKDRELTSVLQRNRELQNEYAQLSATYADRCVLL